ncbi:MAG: zinc-ribbon domain-containing protein [bacterium]
MRIYCPFCMFSYDIEESLLPEGNIKVRCKHCKNIFIINKKTGVINDKDINENINEFDSIAEKESNDLNKNEIVTDKEEIEENSESYVMQKENENLTTQNNIFESEEIKKILKEITDDVERPAVKLNDDNKKIEIDNDGDNISNRQKKQKTYKNNAIRILFLILLILLIIIIILYMSDLFGIIYIPYLAYISQNINENFFKLISKLISKL